MVSLTYQYLNVCIVDYNLTITVELLNWILECIYFYILSLILRTKQWKP